jgi:ribosomal protein L37AE/L43A
VAERRPWTTEDDRILTTLREAGSTYGEIATALDRTKSAVSQRARELGLTRAWANWTATELDYLRVHWGEQTPAQIGRALKRTRDAVKTQAGKLGLVERRSPDEICHDCQEDLPRYRRARLDGTWRCQACHAIYLDSADFARGGGV